MLCSWDEGQTCYQADWVLAWMCDRCDDESVIQICDAHYNSNSKMRFACPECRGTVSYMAQQIHGNVETEAIN